MKKSLLFDLDGTLWDPIDMIITSWDRFMDRHELPRVMGLKEKLPATLGTPSDEFGPILLPNFPRRKQEEIVREICKEECKVTREMGGDLYPGLTETLKTLSQKYELFIVSNCQSGYIEAFLDYYQDLKPLFRDWECFGNTGKSKGENIRRVIERNNLSPIAFVGDKESDKEGAHQNNLPFIWAEYGFGENVKGWEWKIEAFGELLSILEKES